ncbi:MAG TPA: hypothetical protein ENI23_11005 [bacterium]|nr:hypothetical protein [bacterium]
MSKGNIFENELLEHILNNANIINIGDATGLRGSAAAGSLYISLHTADPGEAGSQTANECAYTSYARVAIARSGALWTVTGNSASPASEISFPTATGGLETATHFAVGTSVSGAGKVLYSGTVTPNIVIASGVTPKLTTASTITED